MIVIEVLAFVLVPVTSVLLVWKGILFIKSYRSRRLEHLYDEWIGDIVSDPRTNLQELLRHIHHHTDEAMTEGMSTDWLASMENLIEIVRRQQQYFEPTIRHRLERLYLHWQADPHNTTGPPIIKSLRRLMRVLPDPPDVQPAPPQRQQRREEIRIAPPEDDRTHGRDWHGS